MTSTYNKYLHPLLFIFLLSSTDTIVADEFHYNNILIGDRAAGLAGAYVAVSDDPSGLFYNPAGLVYASTNNISGSMNAIHSSETIYKSALGDATNWVRNSRELLPNFFGVIQDLFGGKAGFSYAVVDSRVENQDQTFYGLTGSAGTIDSYSINFNNQDKTIYFGPSYAYEVNDKFSFGLTLYGHYRQKERILQQYIDINGAATGGYFEQYTSYNSLEETGLRPIFGLMYSPLERFSLGLTLAQTFILTSDGRTQQTETQYNTGGIMSSRTEIPNDNKRYLPLTLSSGIALFLNSSLLVSADLTFQEAYSDRIAVLNFAIGSEFYMTPTWALRTGVFSNLANTQELTVIGRAPGSSQNEHIDYFGLAFSASRFSKNNTLSVGINMSQGRGEAQLFRSDENGGTKLQSVSSTIITVFLSATYSY